MTESVPKVFPIEDIKWRVGECLRIAANHGHPEIVWQAMALARMTVEELKVLANEGKYNRAYVDNLVVALDRSEAEIEKKLGPRDAGQ